MNHVDATRHAIYSSQQAFRLRLSAAFNKSRGREISIRAAWEIAQAKMGDECGEHEYAGGFIRGEFVGIMIMGIHSTAG